MEFFTETSFSVMSKKVADIGCEIIDSHAHAYEYTLEDLTEIFKRRIGLISVAEDLESSIKNMELYEQNEWIKPCMGIHPWRVNDVNQSKLNDLERLISSTEVICIGEIGLDTRFTPETIDRQREIFSIQLKWGKEYGLPLNLHSAGTWREVFEILIKRDITSALFHWYTGPLDLLDEITSSGYFISINPSVIFQDKHRKVAEYVSLNFMLLESDGPYEYRGKRLWSPLILETAKYLAEIKKVPESHIYEKTYHNAVRLFNLR